MRSLQSCTRLHTALAHCKRPTGPPHLHGFQKFHHLCGRALGVVRLQSDGGSLRQPCQAKQSDLHCARMCAPKPVLKGSEPKNTENTRFEFIP